MTRKILIALLIGTAFLLAIFALWPGIDLGFASLFFDAGTFIGRGPVGKRFRRIFYDAPYFLLGSLLLAAIAGWSGRAARGLACALSSFLSARWRLARACWSMEC